MTSMTGYSYKEVSYDSSTVCVEFKSVNSRFLDLTINLPPHLNSLERKLYNIIAQKVSRGKVDVFIRIKDISKSEKISANINAALEYSNAISQIANALGKNDEDIPLSFILNQSGVLVSDNVYDVEKYWDIIKDVFNSALCDFCVDRQREGENLFNDLLEKIAELEECVLFFKSFKPKMESSFKDTITKKFAELLGDEIDEKRVLTEVAALLVKYTINEEIIRLESHISSLRYELKNNSTPGRKIDFICQEINREINTIGSKNQFIEVSAKVIQAKDALENIREQARNVE